jgi:Transposase
VYKLQDHAMAYNKNLRKQVLDYVERGGSKIQAAQLFQINVRTEQYPNFWTGKLKIILQLARRKHETHPSTDIYS